MSRDCVLAQAGDAAEGRTGVTYAAGISASSAGANGLCLQLASLPPEHEPEPTGTMSMSRPRT